MIKYYNGASRTMKTLIGIAAMSEKRVKWMEKIYAMSEE